MILYILIITPILVILSNDMKCPSSKNLRNQVYLFKSHVGDPESACHFWGRGANKRMVSGFGVHAETRNEVQFATRIRMTIWTYFLRPLSFMIGFSIDNRKSTV